MHNSRTITASVVLITYNHRAFITQALDSVLSQQTNFPVEVIVADDASKDGTADIIRDYAGRHPDKLKAVLRSQNLGMHGNFSDALSQASGSYIALLEGDDYWTDPLKLQKQVDFLEKNGHCSACFHPTHVIYEDGRPGHPLRSFARTKQEAAGIETTIPTDSEGHPLYRCVLAKDCYGVADFLASLLMHTSSLLFRRESLTPLPPWTREFPWCDWSLILLLAHTGPVGFIADTMSTYRIHVGGTWSAGVPSQQWRAEQQLKWANTLILFYNTLDNHFGGVHRPLIHALSQAKHFEAVWACQRLGDYTEMRRYFWAGLAKKPGCLPEPFVVLARYFIASHLPLLHRLRQRFRSKN